MVAQIPSCLAGCGWTRGNDHQPGSNPDVTGRYLLAANADLLVPRANSPDASGSHALAKSITFLLLILQAEEDKSVLITATRKFYDALASSDKTWKSYPGYAHDSELEADRSLMDNDIVGWIQARL